MPPKEPSAIKNVTAATSKTTADTAVHAIDQDAIGAVAITAMDAGLLVMDMQGRILWANPAYARLTGRDLESVIGRNPLSFALPQEDRMTQEELDAFRFTIPTEAGPQIERLRNMRANGDLFWVEVRTSFTELPEFGTVAVLVATDVTAEVEAQSALESHTRELHWLAQTDTLTGLYNRYGARRALNHDLQDIEDKQGRIGLLDINLHHFKSVNDTFGPEFGDRVLQHTADTIADSIGLTDTAARMGGGEFLVIRRNISNAEDLITYGEDLIQRLQEPVLIGEKTISTEVRVGAALASHQGLSADHLLQQAGFALSCAKEAGQSSLAIYDKALHTRRSEEGILARELSDAVEAGTLNYVFQPIKNVVKGEIRGFETLVRWNNERLGPMSPADFLPLAKREGLIGAIDNAAFRAAIDLKQNMQALGFADVRSGFNASAEFLAQENLVDKMLKDLAAKGIAPRLILIEILETVVFHDISDDNPVVKTVNDLHEAGFGVMLDDFGTGYAGLTHLAQLNVTGVKIDRSLTQMALTDQTSRKILRMMYELCSDVGLVVVTEGVSNPDELSTIRDLGGSIIQGYEIGKPMSKDAALQALQRSRAPAR